MSEFENRCQWWEFWDTKESMFNLEFCVRCKECGEFFAVRRLASLPDECPECKERREQ